MSLRTALAHHTRRLYSKLLPTPCLLCGLPTAGAALCDDCIADLPLLGPACPRCAQPLPGPGPCGRCLQSPPPQDACFCLLRYQGTARRCVTAFKFRRQLQLAKLFADMMAARLRERESLPQCLTPIPLHPRRLRSRGYNQARLLSGLLADSLSIARRDLLVRTRHTPPQASLPVAARRRNIRRAFRCTQDRVPAHVAIIDDVMTSGQTCGEAARILRAHGAEHIEVWTIARTMGHY